MHSFTLTRKQMADLLIAIQKNGRPSPLCMLKQAWSNSNNFTNKEMDAVDFSLNGILKKLINNPSHQEVGFSINEIVSLGNQIEYSSFSTSAVQNWVKRDVRGLIGSPMMGKKYALEQAALLFIVDDLKSTLDFVSIRHLLTLIFNNIEDRNDDIIDPIQYYATYATIFEELDLNKDYVVDVDHRIHQGKKADVLVSQKVEEKMKRWKQWSDREQSIVKNALVISALSVQTSYFQSVSRQYLNLTLSL